MYGTLLSIIYCPRPAYSIMLFVRSMIMLEPFTASMALYFVSKSKTMFRSHKKTVGLLRHNRHEIIISAVEEIAEPALDIMQSMVPSWITLILYVLLWVMVLDGMGTRIHRNQLNDKTQV